MQEFFQNQKFQELILDKENGNKNTHQNIYSEQDENNALNQVNSIAESNLERNISQKVDHKITFEELKKKYNTNLSKGITDEQADVMLKKYGENKLDLIQQRCQIFYFLRQMANAQTLQLIISITFFLLAYLIDPISSRIYLAIAVVLFIFITSFISFKKYSQSGELMDFLKQFIVPQSVDVIRNSLKKSINSKNLVIGDLVIINQGERIPADIRITFSDNMYVDNSNLNGESKHQLCTDICSHPESYLEASNMVFFGTHCTSGYGEGIVVSTGQNRILQKYILDLEYTEKKLTTCFHSQVSKLQLFIFCIDLLLGIAFIILSQYDFGFSLSESFFIFASIVAASTPQVFQSSFPIQMFNMAKSIYNKKIFVKNLKQIQTLGSVSCICTDKTGVLSQNIMAVQNLFYKGALHKSKNVTYLQQGEIPQYDIEDADFKILQKAAILSSVANFDISSFKDQQNIDYMNCPVIGDTIETGIIRFYQQIEDINQLRQRYKIAVNPDGSICRILFNNLIKYSLTIVEEQLQDSDLAVYIKGVPERILNICSSKILNGKSTQLNNQEKKKIIQLCYALNRDGNRIIGYAKLHLSATQFPKGQTINMVSFENLPIHRTDLEFCGMISFRDPPKQNIPESIQKLRAADIKIIMMTNDHPEVATSFAKQLNIIPKWVLTNHDLRERNPNISNFKAIEQCKAIIITGQEIDDYIFKSQNEQSDEFYYLRQWIKKPYCIFTRVGGNHKNLIVDICQQEGYIVAGIGNSTNNYSMIKQANVGICMSKSGSDLVKNSSDIILLEDDFSLVINAIEERRKLSDQQQKIICYFFSQYIIYLAPFLSFLIFKIPLPLSSIDIVILSISTQFLPIMSLVHEEPDLDLMIRKPKDQALWKSIFISLFSVGMIASVAGHFAYFVSFNYFGFPVNSLFGLASFKGFELPQKDFGSYSNPLLNNQQDPFFNQYLYNITKFDNCSKPKYQEDISNLYHQINWFDLTPESYDLRKSLLYCDPKSGAFLPSIDWSECNIYEQQNQSPLTEQTACYTKEALNYAQSAFFISIILQQWFNVFIFKSRQISFLKTSFDFLTLKALVFQTILAILLLYVPGVQKHLGGRPLQFWFWTTSSLFNIFLLIQQEFRKYCCKKYRWFYKYFQW